MEDDVATPRNEHSNVKRSALTFFSHPFVGIIGSIASIISIPLAVYFFAISIRSPNLTYYFQPLRTGIISVGDDSNLVVSYAGKPIAKSVYILQFAIWNAGELPVKREEVLEKLQLKADSSTRILAAKIRQKSRDITNISLDLSLISKGIIFIDWNILEKNDGAAVQVTYEGSANAKFEISGIIIGQKELSQISPNVENKFDGFINGVIKRNKYSTLIVWYALTIIYLAIFLLTIYINKKIGRNTSSTAILALITTLILMVISICRTVIFYSNQIPFDF